MYTPYEMPKGASADEIAKHAGERAFYDMTGADNIFKYITTEGKRTGKFTAGTSGRDEGAAEKEQGAYLAWLYFYQRGAVAQDRYTRKVHRAYTAHVSAVFIGREIP